MNNEKAKKNKVWLILAIIFILVAIVTGGMMLFNKMNENKVQDSRESLASKVNESSSSEQAVSKWNSYSLEEKYKYYKEHYGIDVPRKNLDFEEMHKSVNSDIYAWISLPGTDIEDPIVQHPTIDDYYLDYNLDGSKGYPGGIYTQGTYNSKDFMDRMTVVYGHDMMNGKAFGTLHNLENKTTFEESKYIYVYTADDILVYRIFAAYEGSNTHIIYGHSWNDETWVEYLQDALLMDGEKDNAIDKYNFKSTDKVITLSTCIRNKPDQRYLVQGVLLDDGR